MNAVTLDQAINTAMKLPPDQQDMLIDILNKWRIETRRYEIMVDANKSIVASRGAIQRAIRKGSHCRVAPRT